MPPGISDLLRTVKNPDLVLFMAWSDVRARYKRSVLGPLWITLGTAIGVVGLGLVWSQLFHIDRKTFVPALTIGLILWQFLSGSIVEATTVFVRQSGLIRNLDIPISFHPAQLVLRQLINLAHNIPLFFVVALLLDSPLNWDTLLALPALALVILNMLWIVIMMGVLGARYRDLEYLVSMIMPLLLFFSPVMYRPNALSGTGKLIWLNPLTSLIEIVRYPLLGQAPPLTIVASDCAMLAIGWTLTLLLFNAKRNRVAMWV